MPSPFEQDEWALILGGSSGFGLATAHRLSREGLNICVVHRDRRGAMRRIEPEFEAIRARGVSLAAYNADALDCDKRGELLDAIGAELGAEGRIRVLLHSIAFGNLKLVAPEEPSGGAPPGGGDGGAEPSVYPDRYLDEEDMARTVHAMGTSLLAWTQDVHARGLFAPDARVFGLTSEGNTVAWKGYAAVAAAKVALESVSRSIAVEMAHFGIRSNIIQAGVTDTPALRLIPGSERLKAQALSKNPFGRLTTPQDVANVIYLLSLPEAAWVNGDVIRVDGGEHVSGLSR